MGNENKNNYNLLVSFTAGVGGLLFGYEIGVIGQVLAMQPFIDLFNTSDANNSAWVASMFQFGCVFGAGIFSVLADFLGRKYSIIISGFTFAVGGAVQASSSSLAQLLVGRAVSGLAIGTASMVVPLYLAETAPSSTRGAVTTIYQLMITFGILIAAVINTIIIETTDQTQEFPWRLAMGMQIIPSILLIFLVYFIPFSPRWLAEKGRHEEGLSTIAKLRGVTETDAAALEEYGQIRAASEYEASIGEASWREVFQGSNGKRITIAVVNQALQQLTGINIILYFGPHLYSNMGFSAKISNEVMPIVFDFVNFICTFPGMWGIDRFGRKPLLTWGGLGMAVAHAGVYAFGTLGTNNNSSGLSAVALVFVALFYFFFASTWGPVVWSYQAEIFPLRIRAKGVSLATMVNWLTGAIMTWAFPKIEAALSNQANVYWIFFTFCVIMFFWAMTVVPETRGKTLEEIGEVFGDKPRDEEYASGTKVR